MELSLYLLFSWNLDQTLNLFCTAWLVVIYTVYTQFCTSTVICLEITKYIRQAFSGWLGCSVVRKMILKNENTVIRNIHVARYKHCNLPQTCSLLLPPCPNFPNTLAIIYFILYYNNNNSDKNNKFLYLHISRYHKLDNFGLSACSKSNRTFLSVRRNGKQDKFHVSWTFISWETK